MSMVTGPRLGALMVATCLVAGLYRPCWADDPPSTSTPTVAGLSGLIRVPTATVLPQGMFRLSWTPAMHDFDPSIGARSAYAIGSGFLPNTEFSISVGTLTHNYDLVANGKVVLRSASARMPAMAIGATDVARSGPNGSTAFAVATWPMLDGRVALTLGGAAGGNAGLLAGAQYYLSPNVELQAEYDTRRVNVGVVGRIGDRAFVRLADLSVGTTFTGGYTFPMAYLPPRRLERPGGAATDAAASAAVEKIKNELVGSGLEDVQITVAAVGDRQSLAAAYEDRLFTVNQLDGLSDVLATMARNAPSGVSEYVVRLRRRGLVMVEYRLPAEAYRRVTDGVIEPRELAQASTVTLLPATKSEDPPAAATEVANSSAGHVDVVLSPGIRNVVGTEVGAFRIGVLGRAEVVVPLGRGLQAQSRWQYPLGGELVRDVERRWRSDRAVVSYAFAPAPGWLAQIIAGRFPGAADGAVLEVLTGVGRSGVAHLVVGNPKNDRMGDRIYWLADYTHMIPQWRAQLRLLGGRFMSADTGVGADLIRSFGAVDVLIGYRETSTSRLMELRLSFPLGPRKQPARPSGVRVRLAEYVDHSLRSIMEGVNYLYKENITARELSLGPDLRDTYLSRYRLHPDSGWWPGQ